MKKILFGTACLLLMANCNSNNTSEKAHEDSAVFDDSTTQIVTTDTAAPQATQESIQMEPVQQESAQEQSAQNSEEFAKVVKALEKLPTDKNKIEKYLKGLGFKGSKKISKRTEDNMGAQMEIEVEKYHYTLTMGDKSITYTLDYEDSLSYGSSTQKITIIGDEDALNNFYKSAKKKDADVKKAGNTVIITEGWA